MRVISSTDNKYLGYEVQEIKVGDIIELDTYTFEVQFVHTLADGNICVGNTNYQFELSQE